MQNAQNYIVSGTCSNVYKYQYFDFPNTITHNFLAISASLDFYWSKFIYIICCSKNIICIKVLVVFHCQLIEIWSNVYPFLNLLLLITKYRIKGERKGEICITRFYLMSWRNWHSQTKVLVETWLSQWRQVCEREVIIENLRLAYSI